MCGKKTTVIFENSLSDDIVCFLPIEVWWNIALMKFLIDFETCLFYYAQSRSLRKQCPTWKKYFFFFHFYLNHDRTSFLCHIDIRFKLCNNLLYSILVLYQQLDWLVSLSGVWLMPLVLSTPRAVLIVEESGLRLRVRIHVICI